MSDRDARYGLDDPADRDADAYDDADDDEDYPPEGGRRKRRGRSIPGCLAALVALALIAGGAYVAVTKGAEFIRDQFSTAPDYPGPGRGKVTFEVESGDTVGQIGRNLKAKGVVQSVDAFIEASNGESGIQVGYYQLKKEMRAADAFDILSNPANIIKNTVTIPEGLPGHADRRRCWPRRPTIPAKAFEKVLAEPGQARAARLRRRQRRGLPVPVDVRLRPQRQARRHAQEDGRPLAAGGRRRRPRGGRRRDGLHARTRS